MADFSDWLAGFGQPLADSLRSVGEYLPLLVAALGLMVIGWLVARLIRALFIRLVGLLNRILEQLGWSRSAKRMRLSDRLVTLIGNVAFWAIILLFAAMATRAARLDAFSGWLDRVVAYLPTLLAGGLIALAGYLVSTLIRDVVSAALESSGSAQHELFGLAAQGAVFLTAVIIGLDQIGIDVTFLITLLAVLVGGLLLSLAFAFGFGARDFVGNLIAAHHVQRMLERGQHARIGDVEGRVLDITPTNVIMLTEQGRLFVPAKLFQQKATLILADDENE